VSDRALLFAHVRPDNEGSIPISPQNPSTSEIAWLQQLSLAASFNILQYLKYSGKSDLHKLFNSAWSLL
jgi:hypothetical protein